MHLKNTHNNCFAVFGYLGNVSYSNNSVVNLNDTGLNDNALFCYTNLSTCCRGDDNPNGGSQGSWMFPEGNAVGRLSLANNNEFSRNRSERAVVLHRGMSASRSTGIFTCVIPDSNNVRQQVYFGIYNIDEGKL